MSSITIHSSIVSGTMQAPPSKSCMQRVCAAALLKGGETVIENYGISNDDKAAIEITKQLGADLKFEDNKLIINSKFSIINNQQSIINIDCGESGLSLRMFTPIAALLNQEILITGEGSLLNRPIDFFDEILPQLDVKVETKNGKLPINIKGALQPQNIEIDGSLSSQFLTGLLFAYSYKKENAIIKVNNLKSKPYIDLTLQVMEDFGLNVPVNKDYKEFVFSQYPIPNTQYPVNYTIEGDWSNASFLLVAGAIAGEITVAGLNINSTQADKAIIDVLKKVGCKLLITASEISVATSAVGLNAFSFDATHCPDLFPPLVALASCCNGVSTIKGVTRLLHKESNRAISLQQEFGKMGVTITIDNDTMFIEGTRNIQANKVNSHNDHRIAMACAVAALKANGNMFIENAHAINKSYPNFYDDLKGLGAIVA
ncbi:MAG: 3-phosphoshikimate 1-carboxyvinyltransferase [Chitinophagaceae bacterium]